MATSTNSREVGENLNLIRCNQRFYTRIEQQFASYYDSKDKEAREIHDLLTSQQAAAELSDDELQELINDIEERLIILKKQLDDTIMSDEDNVFERRLELIAEIQDCKNKLTILNSELNIRVRVNEEIENIKETIKPKNTPENMKRLSELEKSRESRLSKARSEEYELLKNEIHKTYEEYRRSIADDIAASAKEQVRFIAYLYENGKMTDKEEIYQALNELLTRKNDDNILDEIVFKSVYEELSLHSDLFIIWNSYNELKEEKKKPPVPPVSHPTVTPKQPLPSIPSIEPHKRPDLTWKTAAAIVAGIGLGTGVFFAFGGTGIVVLSIAGVIGKAILNKKRQELIDKYYKDQIEKQDEAIRQAQEMNNNQSPIEGQENENSTEKPSQVEVTETQEPTKGLKGAIKKFRKYINSEEGIRDFCAFLSSAVIAGNVLNFINILTNGALLNDSKITDIDDGGKDISDTDYPSEQTNQVSADTVKIGDQVGSHDVSTGYDSASYSVTHTNAESLIPEHINGTKSVFKEFAIMDSTGQTVLQRISTNGLTAADAAEQFGVPLEQIAVNVGRAADGADQAWISVNELIGQAGKIK